MGAEIEKLESIYKGLPDVPEFSTLLIDVNNGVFEYKTDGERFTSKSVLDEPDISIAKSKIKKGSTVPMHRHSFSYELVIVLEGEISIVFEGAGRTLKKHDFIVIENCKPHSAQAIEDSEFVAITVPRDEGFPRKIK